MSASVQGVHLSKEAVVLRGPLPHDTHFKLNIASDQLEDEAMLVATLESSLPLMMQNSIYKCAAQLQFASPSSFMAYG